LVFSSNISA
jgi:hypothetical protein